MKVFHTVAVPHEDILEGRLTMDVFAADLWEVFNNRGPDEYKDAETFFKKTFMTKGLNNLLKEVQKRLKGKGGDAVIQLQTPFGGGKTHALIALYHKAKEWNANVFVFVGDKLSPTDKVIWEELERQLTGKVKELKGKTVPSGEKIRNLLKAKQPVILLIDELIEYLIPARGIKVGNSTFDAQILSFIKRLTEVVSSLEKCILLVTSPSRVHYTEEEQKLLNLLSERIGRIGKEYAPISDEEVPHVIRRRLFSDLDEKEVKKIVSQVVDYFKKESILPSKMEPSQYKAKFIQSYPFLPDVIECLYHRWGSFPDFQRTRGVLRLLSLVIYSLKNSRLSYISFGDIDLKNMDIRNELVKNIGNEYHAVISADITDKNSGSKQVDISLGSSYKGLQLGTRCSTTIFLYSFSGGIEKGANINEIKRHASLPSIPSSTISDVVDMLSEPLTGKLGFIERKGGKIFFTNRPNINRILLTKMENIEEKNVINTEFEYLKSCIKEGKLKTYLWPKNSADIPDDPNLKLVILKEDNKHFIKEIIENKGNLKRINRNTIFFLAPLESKRQELHNSIKRKLAFEALQEDSSLKLSDEQNKEIRNSIKKEEENIQSKIREIYRIIYVPQKNKLETLDLGIPTYGFEINIPIEVFEKLKSEGVIIENIAPLVLKERYLKDKKYVSTKKIYENSLRTLGEDRILSKDLLQRCIEEGVKQGVFCLGELKDGEIIPIYWKKEATVGLGEYEVLIDPDICTQELEIKVEEISQEERKIEPESYKEPESKKETLPKLELPPMKIPKGKVSQILGLLNYLQSKFDDVEIIIRAENGYIDKEDYERKIKEVLRQLGLNL